MRKYGFVISAMLLTAVPVSADARKPFIGICEGIVQLGFFIDGKVSAPVGRAEREKSIGRYTCIFSDSEISNICPNGSRFSVSESKESLFVSRASNLIGNSYL
jgi:hypothetical protein